MTRPPSTIGSVAANTTTQTVLASLGCLTMASIALLPMTSRAALVEGNVVCYNDRPCIESAVTEGNSIQLYWRNNLSYDFYKVRWSRPGKDESDIQLAGGQTGSLAVSGVAPNTRYTFKLQGCNGQIIGGPVCSNWEVQEIETGEGVADAQPTPEASPGSEPASTPPPTPSPSAAQSGNSAPGSSPANATPLNTPPLETAPAKPAPPASQPSGTAPDPGTPSYVVPVK